MRIAAGGLQSIVAHDAMPQRSPSESQARITQDMAQNMSMAGASTVNRRDLNKALEKLNKSAKLYQMGDEFKLMEENGEIYVALVDKATGEVKRKMTPERFLANQDDTNSGVMLDFKG